MPVAGLRGTGDWGTDERPKNFRESILWMEPNGDTPMLGLSSMVKGKKMTVDDPEFSWWNEPMDLVRLQVSAEVAAGESLITVDSGDPTAANIKQNFGKATHLVPGDILMVEPATDSATDDYERVMVTQVHSDTQFSVKRGVSGTTPGTIVDDAYLLLVGSAFAEGTAGPQSTTRNPVKFFNYTQIFKTSYEITKTADVTRARTGNALTNDKKRRSFDHARALEMALLFGKRAEGVGDNGKPLRFMGGLRSFIPADNQTILGADWGLYKSAGAGNNLMDAMSPIFDYSSPGGDTRVALCGNGALNALNKAIADSSGSSGVQIYWGSSEKYWGMNFRELIFPQGRIMLKTHPLMSRHSLYTNSMMLCDFSAVKYVPLTGRDTKAQDDIQTKDEDVRRGQWLTETSLMVDYAGQTQGYIGGFNAASA
jgi:hypothetical protein